MGVYDDIINLPHHRSGKHPAMSLHDRAAQFAPFAALTGYEQKVSEAARLTEEKAELSETKKEELDAVLQELCARADAPTVRVTYFAPDERKAGGAYLTRCVRIKRTDGVERRLLFTDGTAVPLEDVSDLEILPEEK